MFSKNIGKWLEPTGPEADVVLSSRVRLARNIRGLLFPGHASPAELESIVQHCETALHRFSIYEPDLFVRNQELTPLRAGYLTERHLISPDFLRLNQHKAAFILGDETLSVMINEEDHLRLQVLASGLDLGPVLKELQTFDDALGGELGYAFSEQLGFLTACPTNVGTGLRASVLIHLPGLVLSREIDKILRGALQVGLAVRGLFGEGTETKGNLFQISNQVTLGKSEEEIVEGVAKTTQDIIGYERKMRDYLLEKLKPEVEDKVFRADAVLRSARLLSSAEATNLLGVLRLGVTTGLLPKPDLRTLNELLILCRPSNLQVYFDQEMPSQERDARRAELVRARLLSV